MNFNYQQSFRHFICLFSLLLLLFSTLAKASVENDAIQEVLNKYIQGTSYNYPDKINDAFYSDANLLLEKEGNAVWRVPIKEYVNWFDKNSVGDVVQLSSKS